MFIKGVKVAKSKRKKLYIHIVNYFFLILRVLVVILAILIASCDRSSSTTAAIQDLKLLDTVIDYNSVDVYPLFSDCQEIGDKEGQRNCFESALTELLAVKLQRYDYEVKAYVNDSSYVDLLINSNGKTKVVAINSPPVIRNNLPQLDSIIEQSVAELPIVKPALKRGIPVRSQYKLAVVVRSR